MSSNRTSIFRLALCIGLVSLFCACADDDDEDDVDMLTFESSLVEGHTHMLELAVTTVDLAPESGFADDTSVAEEHVHAVELTQEQLLDVRDGELISVNTTINEGHEHMFQIFTNLDLAEN